MNAEQLNAMFKYFVVFCICVLIGMFFDDLTKIDDYNYRLRQRVLLIYEDAVRNNKPTDQLVEILKLFNLDLIQEPQK